MPIYGPSRLSFFYVFTLPSLPTPMSNNIHLSSQSSLFLIFPSLFRSSVPISTSAKVYLMSFFHVSYSSRLPFIPSPLVCILQSPLKGHLFLLTLECAVWDVADAVLVEVEHFQVGEWVEGVRGDVVQSVLAQVEAH